MTRENSFNLIDEPWIPIVDVGRVSLKQLFSQPNIHRALGGNPIQKIALTKLLLAIAQAAHTPEDNEKWGQLGVDGLSKKCMEYLEKWHDRFYLYGDRPFLQMPAIKLAKIQNIGAVMPEVSTGNTTVLTQSQVEKKYDDAAKALLIVQLMGFALGGKKTDNTVVLSKDYKGKSNDKGRDSTGKPGTSIGQRGFLHSFLQGKSVAETLWLNLFTSRDLEDLKIFQFGLGNAPWEKMPEGEDCDVAKRLKSSLMGRLVPLSRFCLLADSGLHYSEGLAHLDYKDGMADPSMSVDFTVKDPKAIWVDPEKRPWRILTSLLSFFGKRGFDCYQLRLTIPRSIDSVRVIGIWSGGLRVSSNAGEQFVSGSDDYVESILDLQTDILGEGWFSNLGLEMDRLDDLSKKIWKGTFNYFNTQKMESKGQVEQASNLFWQLSERQFQSLLDACGDSERVRSFRSVFVGYANSVYDTYCAKETARQLDAWARNRPDLRKYLYKPNKQSV